ncbi:MAG: squalene/phytoene synthase family protein [Paracoccus sp. (in: a-proteobacteria)]|nr:squalene/phytoene synthase family protein [Paracoccus sp. (in: a-proteobacteria)]
MTLALCAESLRAGDPDRFAAVMAARPGDRARLVTLYAANLAVARAALASAEPLISEMRLQWWADQIAAMGQGGAPAGHEIATPLFAAWGAGIAPLATLIEARRRDTRRQPPAGAGEVLAHVEGCTGTVMRLAAMACGHDPQSALLRDQARGAGLAAWLGAYPRLRALNLGLADDSPAVLGDLAGQGLRALDSARAARPRPDRRAAPALYAGAGARAILTGAAAGDFIQVSDFKRKLSHTLLAFAGRWQG